MSVVLGKKREAENTAHRSEPTVQSQIALVFYHILGQSTSTDQFEPGI